MSASVWLSGRDGGLMQTGFPILNETYSKQFWRCINLKVRVQKLV